MANIDNAQGFIPLAADKSLTYYPIDASNSSPLGKGDPLAIDSDGHGSRLAADGTGCIGVIQKVEDSNGLPLKYLPASTEGRVGVLPCEGVDYIIQSDGATAANAVGATVDIAASNCNTTSGQSTFQADHSDIGSGTQLRIIGKQEDNTFGSANVNLMVRWNVFAGSDGSTTI